LYDRWYYSDTQVHVGSFDIDTFRTDFSLPISRYILAMPNLQDKYTIRETPRLRVYSRQKNWNPNIYTKINERSNIEILKHLYYRLYRVHDNEEIIAFGTGSTNHTRLSYDASGSYFDFDMSMLEHNYMYGLNFCYNRSSTEFIELADTFKFRVDK